MADLTSIGLGRRSRSLDRVPTGQRARQLGRLRRIMRANWLSVVGLAIVVGLGSVAAIGPFLVEADPKTLELERQFLPPSQEYPLGTDDLGRDMLSRIVHGARVSLGVGVLAVTIGLVCGSVIGLLAGYLGGWFDAVSQRVIDVMLAFPELLLALAIVAVLGASLANVMIAVGVSAVPSYARLMRGQVLALREREYVVAARTIGARDARILFRHILPNTLSTLVVLATLGVSSAILAGAGLSFIGLGAQPPSPEWGAMLATGSQYLRDEWWIATFPGVALALTSFGFNLLGDGLRDWLDPQAGK